jgi:hypothetical protein
MPCSNAPELSNNVIQKGLAFIGDWCGTSSSPGLMSAQESCPAGLLAKVGLRLCGATPPYTELEDSDAKVFKAFA